MRWRSRSLPRWRLPDVLRPSERRRGANRGRQSSKCCSRHPRQRLVVSSSFWNQARPRLRSIRGRPNRIRIAPRRKLSRRRLSRRGIPSRGRTELAGCSSYDESAALSAALARGESPVTGVCVDCDRVVPVSLHGVCTVCSSSSVVYRGAVAELHRAIDVRDRETRRSMLRIVRPQTRVEVVEETVEETGTA